MLRQFILLTKFFYRQIIFEKRAGAGTTYQTPNAAPTRIRETNRKWSIPVVVVKKSLEMVRGEHEENFRKMKREKKKRGLLPPLIQTLAGTHGALDVQRTDVLPVLLEQRDQEVDGQTDVGRQVVRLHGNVTDSHG